MVCARCRCAPPALRNVQIDSELLEACHDAVAFVSGPPLHLTVRALVEAALRIATPSSCGRVAVSRWKKTPTLPAAGQAPRVGRPLVRA